MGRLLWIPVIVCTLLILLLGGVVIYGHRLPAPPAQHFDEAGLDVCYGKFCLFSVTPGVTSFEDAKILLANYITLDEGDHVHGQKGGANIRVEASIDGSAVRAVQVQGVGYTLNALSLRLNQVIEQFGFPCGVSDVALQSGELTLNYPAFRIQVATTDDRISLDSPISGITLAADDNLDDTNKSCRDMKWVMPWHGFASIQRYESAQSNYRSYPYE